MTDSDDPLLAKLAEWQAKYEALEARLDELERLLVRYRQLGHALATGEPPPPLTQPSKH